VISSTLRYALRTHGFTKLAAAVHRERGEAWVDASRFGVDLGASLGHAVETLSQKIAASQVNDRELESGLASYRRLEAMR